MTSRQVRTAEFTTSCQTLHIHHEDQLVVAAVESHKKYCRGTVVAVVEARNSTAGAPWLRQWKPAKVLQGHRCQAEGI